MPSNAWNRRTIWLVFVASLAFNAGVGATVGVRAYNRYAVQRPDIETSPPDRPRHLLRRLDLSPQQRARLHAARDALRERHLQVGEQLRDETDVLAELLCVSDPDREAVAAQVSLIADLREELDRDMVDHLLEVRRMLQPAQYEAFSEIVRHTLHRGGHGKHGPRGPHGGFRRGRGRGPRG